MYMYQKAKLLSSNEVSVFLCFNGFFDGFTTEVFMLLVRMKSAKCRVHFLN